MMSFTFNGDRYADVPLDGVDEEDIPFMFRIYYAAKQYADNAPLMLHEDRPLVLHNVRIALRDIEQLHLNSFLLDNEPVVVAEYAGTMYLWTMTFTEDMKRTSKYKTIYQNDAEYSNLQSRIKQQGWAIP